MLDDSQILKSEPAWILTKWSTLRVLSQEGENLLFPKVKEQMSKPEEFTTARACWRGDEHHPGLLAESRAGQLCTQNSSEGMSYTEELNRYCLKQSSIRPYLDSLMVTFETYVLIWLWSDRTECLIHMLKWAVISLYKSSCTPPVQFCITFWHKYFPASASETSFPSQSLKHRALRFKTCAVPHNTSRTSANQHMKNIVLG